ncbi:hypothetical protein OQI_10785 [Streptomyces pharetrae CZA14]|uniref:Secreted protein n=1 Tax=Streptomyces pharetrae CZA14 TaxID=1144883 RepID=A0ABX3YMX1_9ACTN|nr:hypothetical protein OQI_10785 [Streptomyces pharetrae CZA14]
MDIIAVVIALLAMIALGAFLIHRLNAQHGDRGGAFHYGPFGSVVRGPAPPSGRKTRGRAAGARGADGSREHREDGPGPMRPRRRTRRSQT